jgi:hypothetical protein
MRSKPLVRVALAALALAACTEANPDYLMFDGGEGDGTAPPCTTGRDCLASGVAGACAGGHLVADRQCPMASTCLTGHCQPPPPVAGTPQGMTCKSETQCYFNTATFNYSCQPFLTPGGGQEMHCAPRIGDGGSGNTCAVNSDCRSGFCIQSIHECFRFCSSDADCPAMVNGKKVGCRLADIIVEGKDLTLASCYIVGG